MVDPSAAAADPFTTHPGYNPHEHRWGNQAVLIHDYVLKSEGAVTYPSAVPSASAAELKVSLRVMAEVHQPIVGFTVKTKEGITVFGTNNQKLQHPSATATWMPGTQLDWDLKLTCHLAPGEYFLSLGVVSMVNGELTPHDRRYDAIQLTVLPDQHFFGLCNLDATMDIRSSTP